MVEALRAKGILSPFPIQELTLPLALAGSDIIGQARTGTGKTLAFGIPLAQQATSRDEGASGQPQALVVVPTRELCLQVTADIDRAGSGRGLRVLPVYGGRAYEPQLASLRAGVDIVVGTPGRLLDLARQNALVLTAVRMLVLDEADEMLDLGFLPDVERILAQLPDIRQTLLFSATMPPPVISLARRFMRRPVHVTAEHPDEGRTVPDISQHVFRAHALDKIEVLARVLQAEGRGLAIVFVRTRRTADRVADDLTGRGFAAAAVHGDIGQGQREQALRAFRSGKIDVLVATDVAARGIDIGGVTHVVNYQCPEDENVYLHRVGRTGRAGGSGVAVTFVDWDDIPRWSLVNQALGLPFDTPVETYSTSPHLFEALSIPADVRGVLPQASRTRAGLAAEEVEDLGETGRPKRRRSGRAGDRPDAIRAEPSAGRPPAARTTRTRRRTRGGGAAVAAVTVVPADEPTDAQPAAHADAPAQQPASTRPALTRPARPAPADAVPALSPAASVELPGAPAGGPSVAEPRPAGTSGRIRPAASRAALFLEPAPLHPTAPDTGSDSIVAADIVEPDIVEPDIVEPGIVEPNIVDHGIVDHDSAAPGSGADGTAVTGPAPRRRRRRRRRDDRGRPVGSPAVEANLTGRQDDRIEQRAESA
ncbi:DEAD/DEAH box helicase [Protofrankia sp. BMG5.30]|uniref:DEAD/DEAH box helicase n=1 Tax=Protofrankia sp. BMG5.30 TaxID=1834514 RepID=UPI0020CA4EDD|nr:DEAD/DEAH box helicase [Protofrankia sp. BMG5.30]